MITTEERLGVLERNGRDCDYGRGRDRIVITREELIGLCVREKNGRDCDYGEELTVL